MFTTLSTQISRPNALVYFAPVVTWMTALTGGGEFHLDAQDVSRLEDNYVLILSIGLQAPSWWKLVVRSSQETDGVTYVVPLGDPARVWVRIA